ncbi:hypothetical protein [Sphaerisporangium sp. NPDC051011]|uniref:hypothetical protein n=1 Tax=Sphaerisporangium sp. NPDC051011 TaxID=3155792 RepID=UPI0034115754
MTVLPPGLTNEQVAGRFIRYGRNSLFAGIMEVVYMAARFEAALGSPLAVCEDTDDFAVSYVLVTHAARDATEVAGMRKLIAAVVKRFAYADPFVDGEDEDPDGSRSRAVTGLLIRHAVEVNRAQDEPVDEEH